MALSEYTLDTAGMVTPEDKNGPRVGIGCHCLVSRATAGAIGISILRGDGGDPEEFTYTVRSKWFGPIEANTEVKVELAALDQPMPDYTPRTYRMRVVADGTVLSSARAGFIATEPYAPAGIDP